VICLFVFQNTTSDEAFTREAAMIDAMGRDNLHNLRTGDYKGRVAKWSQEQRRMLGAKLLLTAKDILVRDGERPLNHDEF